MKKLKSSFVNMVVVLGLITAITSLLLAMVYNFTLQPIQDAEQAKLNEAIENVIDDMDTFKESKIPAAANEDNIDSLTCYIGFNKAGEKVGTAVVASDNNGFAGPITIIVGFDTNGVIYNNVPLSQSETPGLGAKMASEESGFTPQFNGKDLSDKNYVLKVKKDGGSVDAITAATISSRAYCRAVDLAYKSYVLSKGGK